MVIPFKIQDFFQKIKQTSRIKLIGFALLVLVILTLVAEGGYFLYSRTKKQASNLIGKPSSILDRELAMGNEEELFIGVRELSGGMIGIKGYVLSATPELLTLLVKDKEISVAVDSQAVWQKIDEHSFNKETPKEKRELLIIPPEDVHEGDLVDILCIGSKSDLKAINIVVIESKEIQSE